MATSGDREPVAAGESTGGTRRPWSRRTFWHGVGLAFAVALAWLVMRAYRQPEFLLEFSNLRLC